MNNLNRYTLYIQNIIDVVILTISFWLARFLKFSVPFFKGHDFSADAYWKLYLIVIVAYLLFDVFILSKEDLLQNSKTVDFTSSLKMTIYVVLIMTLFAFFTRSGTDYSRSFTAMFAVFSFALDFAARVFIKKKIFPLYQQGKQSKKLTIIGTKDDVEKAIQQLKDTNDWRYQVHNAIITDENLEGSYLSNVKVISNVDDMFETINASEADMIFIVSNPMNAIDPAWIKKFCDMGKSVCLNISGFNMFNEYTKTLDTIDEYSVITYLPTRPFPKRQAFIKRTLDIIIAVCFMPLYLILLTLSFIFDDLGKGGPILYRRIRISKNGRRYYQYRFRMLRMDAKERVEQKKTPFTKWGLFLRKTHLDGLPMILNVISGDMSFVGPHSPTLPSYIEYEPERRKNLSIAAGIVGYWSLSKDKTDVIKDERTYIENWSVLKDISIIFEMVLHYITFRSSKEYQMIRYHEEEAYIDECIEENRPLQYDHTKYHAKKNFSEYVYLFIKRLFDIIVSLLGIVILSPLFLILIILVISDDGGSPFYGHNRIGKNGKRIKIYKFRSMKKDAGDLERLLTPEQMEQYKREFKIDNDPRITKVGNFIRKTSLDELPQLFNILFGQLSIVGPRPIVEKETLIYGDDIGKLLSVKPGLTGYWQAYARNNATYESGERQKMEMYYVDHHNILLDIKIIFKTFGSVAKEEGAQ